MTTERLMIGGEALVEGVMMRSKRFQVICVRRPDGSIVTRERELKLLSTNPKVARVPVFRGLVSLFETMFDGMRNVRYAINEVAPKSQQITNRGMIGGIAIGLLLGLTIFVVLPYLIAIGMGGSGLEIGIWEGGVKIVVLLVYFAGLSLNPFLRRLFMYHGAEHTAINAFEAGKELTVENAAPFSRFNARCGTSFFLTAIVVSIVVFIFVPNEPYYLGLAMRILLAPVVIGLAYELFRLGAKWPGSRLARVVSLPGLGMQLFTTRKPEGAMIEVALAALSRVVELERAPTTEHTGV